MGNPRTAEVSSNGGPPVLRPGDTSDAVPSMKLGLRPVAKRVAVDSKTYGRRPLEV
jgi:hypothetical protein